MPTDSEREEAVRCTTVVDWHCDEHGERGDEINCGVPAFGIHDGEPVCYEHMSELANEGLFDNARWQDIDALADRLASGEG